MTDFSGLLGGLLSDPQTAKIIQGALGALAQTTQAADAGAERESAPETAKTASALALPQPSGFGGLFSMVEENGAERLALLCAIKPYLSRARAEKLESILGALRALSLLSMGEKR